MRRNIYLASSWRNPFQQEIVNVLRDAGHVVYDFKNPSEGIKGFAWSDIDNNWKNWDTQQFIEALHHPIAESGFTNDFKAMIEADCCVLLLPSGRSAHLEGGYFAGHGLKKLVIFSPTKEEPELMYKLADFVSDSMEEILIYLESGNVHNARSSSSRASGSIEKTDRGAKQ
jgi:hypothetical protein